MNSTPNIRQKRLILWRCFFTSGKKYTLELKIQVIEYCLENGSIKAISERFKIITSCIQKRPNRYEKHGYKSLEQKNGAYTGKFKKIERLSSKKRRTRPKDKTIVITELRQKYELMTLLELAKMARSTYYYHLKQIEKPDKYEEIQKSI